MSRLYSAFSVCTRRSNAYSRVHSKAWGVEQNELVVDDLLGSGGRHVFGIDVPINPYDIELQQMTSSSTASSSRTGQLVLSTDTASVHGV